ncbi:PREDICTED: olfactory receptor 52K1-like [Gekko japonicus]|uniref:Olfactory receptor n=1 Tax=Gekko japonicus TaxID=146911 RepID=A0ABM1KLG3_GEKJA|nr:PREDICTED: olfactory receptor 52K1-like [Gekko japonicus]
MSGRGPNGTANVSYTEFFLLAFPGLQQSRYLLAVPFFCLYASIIIGNSMLIYTIKAESSLHSPMYALIALLFGVNVCGTTVILPMMLLSVIFGAIRISLTACLVQMFFLYFVRLVDCNILVVMALDRYMAICHPLRYVDIMTKKLMVILSLVALARSVAVVSPVVILASQVRFCRSNVIGHFVCEHMALMRLSCGDISRNKIVGLLVRTITAIFDLSFLLTSYSRIFHVALQISSGHLRSKAFHTCGTHLMVILTVYSCSLISSIVFRLAKSATQDVHNLISAIYLLLPLAVNPIIYGMRTKEIRNNFLKLFKSKWPPLRSVKETGGDRVK